MSGYNGRGPAGAGPMTGRGMGYCTEGKQSDNSAYDGGLTPGYRQGSRGGRGYARAYRNNLSGGGQFCFAGRFCETAGREMTPGRELDLLATRKRYLESQIETIETRIASLESQQ